MTSTVRNRGSADQLPGCIPTRADHCKARTRRKPRTIRRQFWWRFGRRNTELRSALRGLRAIHRDSRNGQAPFLRLPRRSFFRTTCSSTLQPATRTCSESYPAAFTSPGLSPRAADSVSETIPATTRLAASSRSPFPTPPSPARAHPFLGEQLDAHRKRCQEAYPNRTLTEMYNVLEELRAGQPLPAASQWSTNTPRIGPPGLAGRSRPRRHRTLRLAHGQHL